MKQYLEVMKHILENGDEYEDRTGVGTIAVTEGTMTKYDLQDGFPAVTTKKLAWKALRGEFLWIMQGKTSDRELSILTHGVPDKPTIWTANYENQGKALGYTDGELGAIYGHQLRSFEGVTFKDTKGVSVDQLKYIYNALKSVVDTGVYTRKAHFSYWNPAQLEDSSLEPCHVSCTFNITKNKKLNCLMLMRSNDAFLGESFNIAFYALLMHCFATMLGLDVGIYTHVVANHHIYKNHIEQVKEQLSREPFALPQLKISEKATQLLKEKGIDAFDELVIEDFELINYQHHETIKAEMAV